MFQSLSQYSKYGDAPAPHLPALPTSWEWRRFASIGKQVKNTGRPDLPLLSVYLDRGVIPYADGGKRVHAPSERLDGYQVVQPGDLVLNNQQAWRGSVGISDHHGIVSPAYIVWQNSSAILRRFARYLFRAPVMVNQFVTSSRGVGDIQRDLHGPSLRSVLVPTPPIDHQFAIGKYLAYANLRIYNAIAAKRELVTLLDELDQSVANDLAGSISAESDHQNSVAWLGPMPSRWQKTPAKWLFNEVDRRSVTGTEGLLSLRMHEGLVDANNYTVTPIPSESLVGYKIVQPGDLVMNRMRAAIGLFGVADRVGLVSPDYSTMTVAPAADARFFLQLFKTESAKTEFRRRSNGLGNGSFGFMRLYYEDFGVIPMPVPPREEQKRIVASIEEQRSKTTPLRSRALREIGLLEEFQARLIADVVTGRFDVRAISLTLPDTPESFDDFDTILDDELEEALTESPGE